MSSVHLSQSRLRVNAEMTTEQQNVQTGNTANAGGQTNNGCDFAERQTQFSPETKQNVNNERKIPMN